MKQYDTKKSNSWKKLGIKPKNIPQQEFIDICNSSESMAHAASKLGLHFNTFRKYAMGYGCYNTNQSGKGLKKDFKKINLFCLESKKMLYLKEQTLKRGQVY